MQRRNELPVRVVKTYPYNWSVGSPYRGYLGPYYNLNDVKYDEFGCTLEKTLKVVPVQPDEV